ncbi:MAG: hypothetical protein DRP12_02720 [Candidatus Aenigmatarchaeota archaeon]|nr:MAG: hypothetical protein DRP12_02720 [Candidatus Aenigmarchaeota archaeon]
MRLDPERLKLTAGFMARFLLLSLILYPLLGILDLRPALSLLALSLLHFLPLFGWKVGLESEILKVNGMPFILKPECLSLEILIFLSVLILSVPKVRPGYKLFGLLCCPPLLWFSNLVRIANLIDIRLRFGSEVALNLHNFYWQFGLIALALGLWSLWLFSTPREK